MHSVHHLPAGEASKLTPLRHPRPRLQRHAEVHTVTAAVHDAHGVRPVLRRLTGYLTA